MASDIDLLTAQPVSPWIARLDKTAHGQYNIAILDTVSSMTARNVYPGEERPCL